MNLDDIPDRMLTPAELAAMIGEILDLPPERVDLILSNTADMLAVDLVDMEREVTAQLSWIPTTYEGDVR